MTPPSCRVVALPVTANGRPVENGFNTSTQPAGGLRLGPPNGLQHLQHEGQVNVLDRESAEDWLGVGVKGRPPLLSMLRIPPARLVARYTARRAAIEGYAFRSLEPSLGALSFTGFDWI